MLRRLGFQFAGGGDKRNQRDVHEERVLRAKFQPHLANGFEEGQRFDVADRAADFHDDHVHAVRDLFEGGLDFVGDVRDHLHGLAEVIAAPLLGENSFVDAASGPVIVAGEFGVREALVVAEVQVRLRSVVGHKHFAVLKRAHRAGIHVQVRIAFL